MSQSQMEEKEQKYPPNDDQPPLVKSPVSKSANTLLSASYAPSPNSKKDELVQSASLRIMEVEQLLDKIDGHVERHHRKSSQKLQDFEQIHGELEKIQGALIQDTTKAPRKNQASSIDPFIVIAPNHHEDDDDDEDKEDEKDDEKYTVHNDTLTQLEPFQHLVVKVQKQLDPNMTSSDESEQKDIASPSNKPRRSIKMKQSQLHTIQDYVKEHTNQMKEKTYQYEEKKKQLQSARERLNKAKARFKKRMNKSKQRSRSRAHSEQKRKNMRVNIHHAANTTTDIHNASTLSPRSRFHTINEKSDTDNDEALHLSAANLKIFNSSNGQHSALQHSAPIYNFAPLSPPTPGSASALGYNLVSGSNTGAHRKSGTQSSVLSSFSNISDQSFLDDFQSITTELETIDDLVRTQVKSGSMRSIFSDLATSPKLGAADDKEANKDDHIKHNMSSYSESDSKEHGKTVQLSEHR